MKIKFPMIGFFLVITFLYCSCKYEATDVIPGGSFSGRVIDSTTSTPINQALIVIKGTAGSYDTTFSNTDGSFSGKCAMSTWRIQIHLHFQKTGYQDKILDVELISGENVNLGDIRLRP